MSASQPAGDRVRHQEERDQPEFYNRDLLLPYAKVHKRRWAERQAASACLPRGWPTAPTPSLDGDGRPRRKRLAWGNSMATSSKERVARYRARQKKGRPRAGTPSPWPHCAPTGDRVPAWHPCPLNDNERKVWLMVAATLSASQLTRTARRQPARGCSPPRRRLHWYDRTAFHSPAQDSSAITRWPLTD